MGDSSQPPLVRITWRAVFTFLLVDTLLTAAVIAVFVKVAYGAPEPPSAEAVAVRAVLDAQVTAWNRGDLDGFMAGYWKDERLTFFSGDVITRGWQKTYERYRKRYQADGKEMGRLEFREVQIESVGTEAAFARGRWQLTMKDGSTPNGLFTLLFRRIDGQWRIVHDHT
ncbi:MAG TPA: nuclear transport factor 2 family protein, partial [Gemmataceae bacterium]|nr:nuclear transport factor 2 family protein [Gemmataceae bacterium]